VSSLSSKPMGSICRPRILTQAGPCDSKGLSCRACSSPSNGRCGEEEKTLSELMLISVFCFIAAALATHVLYRIMSRSRRVQSSIKRRLAQSRQGAQVDEALNALRGERGLAQFQNPLLRRLNDLLAQSGLRIDRNLLALCAVSLSLLLFVTLGLLFGFG